MLTDPLVVKSLSLVAHTAITVAETLSFPRIDAGDGSARYVLASPEIGGITFPRATLKISHSVSNENKPAKTDRTLVRLDVDMVDADGRAMTAFAYLVTGLPQGAQNIAGDTAEPVGTAEFLGILQVFLGAAAVNVGSAALDETKILRILKGES